MPAPAPVPAHLQVMDPVITEALASIDPALLDDDQIVALAENTLAVLRCASRVRLDDVLYPARQQMLSEMTTIGEVLTRIDQAILATTRGERLPAAVRPAA